MIQARSSRRALMLGTLSAGAVPAAGGAQSWPTRPVRIIVGFPPGGPVDLAARMVQPGLQAAWGQPVVIENRPGANSIIAFEACARAAPDGYTLVMGGNILTLNVALYRHLPYDTLMDLAPIVLLYGSSTVLFTGPEQPWHDVAAVIAAAKVQPGALTFSTSGTGSPGHFAGEMFNRATGVELTHVAYRGGPAALQDVVAGRVPLSFSTLTAGALQLAQSGRLRALAIAGPQRLVTLPGVPTLDELGIRIADTSPWIGLLAPAGTPTAIVQKIASDASALMRQPSVAATLAEQSAIVVNAGPDAFATRIREEAARWTEVARLADMKVE